MPNRTVAVQKNPVTWILVADGKRAHVYTRRPVEKRIPMVGTAKHRHYDETYMRELVQVPGMAWEAETLEEYELAQAGRIPQETIQARHEPHLDVRDTIRERLMRSVASALNEEKAVKSYDRLVLAAPPKCLGVLRTHLSKEALAAVVAELTKDLTHCENGVLAKHLESIA